MAKKNYKRRNMIEKIEINGNDYKVDESLKRYAEKRLGKLDKYLPRGSKKDIVVKVMRNTKFRWRWKFLVVR